MKQSYKLGIVNYGAGNFKSVCNALDFMDIKWFAITRKEDYDNATHIILPGVGAYKDCMMRLADLDLQDSLIDQLTNKYKIFLGICVGHQVLSTIGMEFEKSPGLGLIPGKTIKIKHRPGMPVPHIGWAEVLQKKITTF